MTYTRKYDFPSYIFYFFHFPRIYSWIYSNLLRLHRFYTIISVLISFTRKVHMLISLSPSLSLSEAKSQKREMKTEVRKCFDPFVPCSFSRLLPDLNFSLFLLCLNSGLISYRGRFKVSQTISGLLLW